MSDAKTGHMAKPIYDVKKATGKLDEATKELLRTKRVRFDLDLARDEWHQLLIRTMREKVVVWVNGKEAGSLVSEGLAHETKSLVSFTTNVNDVHFDDFVLRKAPVMP